MWEKIRIMVKEVEVYQFNNILHLSPPFLFHSFVPKWFPTIHHYYVNFNLRILYDMDMKKLSKHYIH